MQEVATIQAFRTVREATLFLADFQPAAGPASGSVEGELSGLQLRVQRSGTPGREMLSIGSHLAGREYPGDVQFVIQRERVVLTLELVGGDQITSADEMKAARLALRNLAQVCPHLS